MSFFMDRYPELEKDLPKLNPTYYKINLDLNTTPYLYLSEKKKMYAALFWEKMKTDWPIFIKNTVRNVFFLWDKDHLFTYHDPFHPGDTLPLRAYNFGLFAFFFIGIGGYVKRKVKEKGFMDPIVLFTLGLFLYITLIFSPVTNETRHSLPFYPLLFLWAGYGINIIGGKLLQYFNYVHAKLF